eukprot:4033764-Pyramimonas_sp.AAC.1
MLKGCGMAACNTFTDAGPTCYGKMGKAFRVDFIHIPQGLMAHVTSCRVLGSAGRRLQPIQALDDRDHRPVYVEFAYCFQAQIGGQPGWDLGRIMASARRGEG